MTLCIKTGMVPESQVAAAHAAAGTTLLSGDLKVADLDRLVPATCDAILSFGLCGGLRPALPVVGQTIIASRLIGPEGETYEPDLAWVRRLFAATHAYTQPYFSNGLFDTADTPAQRAALYDRYGGRVIDDESLYVAQFAASRKIPFAVLRNVSDQWDDDVQVTAHLLNSSGGVDMAAVLRALVSDPAAMIKIWRAYNLSIAELGTAAVEVGPSFCWPA